MAFTVESKAGGTFLNARSDPSVRGLGPARPGSVGAFSQHQNRVCSIVAVSTASVSLAVAIVALRWFLSMKRSFRHHLILMLVISDSVKALLYFLSPVVMFIRSEFETSSAFSQASGFVLAVGVEGADLSILFIALHTALYIFRPPKRLGQGGLYRYRYLVYGTWLILPLLAAGLAFTNSSGQAYVTTGTVAYLPKRPFWYRLALAWIPRYVIFLSIIAIYSAIYFYVKVKFNGFDDLESDGSSFESSPTQSSAPGQVSDREGLASPETRWPASDANHKQERVAPTTYSTSITPVDNTGNRSRSHSPDNRHDWEKVGFMTASPIANSHRDSMLPLGITAADFAFPADDKRNNEGGSLSPVRPESSTTWQATRTNSPAPALSTDLTSGTAVTATPDESSPTMTRSRSTMRGQQTTDPLVAARIAVRRQLRFLFLYPLIYLFLWVLPFVQHCLTYTDYYTEHPVFWLNMATNIVLALQAGVDCAIFSWRERPWTRMTGPPCLIYCIVQKLRARFSGQKKHRPRSDDKNTDVSHAEGGKGKASKRDSNWWEEEGKRRNDSVWLGTDSVIDHQHRHTDWSDGENITRQMNR